MAARMGIRQLRDNLTVTIRRVRAGETIEITHHGAPVAVLAPASADRVGRLVAGGDVTPPGPPRRPRSRFAVSGEVGAGQAIEDDRAER